ncbi:hypothetical protein ABIC83_003086 [Roseateles asaccharophilus]|uniref:Uncharacterized protein n=1 Tax=Roseateles asaccharophilus TaxID=582607 RepID=A0ABU2AGB7_9BURK|nr:hypothetical protein [Roseateles asaccharophilus]
MKRVRVAPGKFVAVPNDLAEKAQRIFERGLTRDQVRELSATEPKGATGLLAGSPKPLAIAKPWTGTVLKMGATTIAPSALESQPK